VGGFATLAETHLEIGRLPRHGKTRLKQSDEVLLHPRCHLTLIGGLSAPWVACRENIPNLAWGAIPESASDLGPAMRGYLLIGVFEEELLQSPLLFGRPQLVEGG